MNTALNNLLFQVSLIDRFSSPMGHIMNSINKASAGFQSGFTKIGIGAAGLVGAAYSVKQLLDPTLEMQKALGEVRSLDVANDTLMKLQKTATEFSAQYGGSAVDFVRASYQVKSAIDSLTGEELPVFTRAAAILSQGSKANIEDMTSYMGTMYNIFQNTADKMGKSQWIQQMVGQSALAVKIFKAEGKDVSDFFTRIGATATAAQRPLEEQMAVFGMLKATMPGSEAGTVYASFLKNVEQAQAGMDIKLMDSQNRMLPMIDILEKIKGKYGDFIDVVEGGELGGKHGFGSEEAVKLINLLLPKMDQLRQNTALLGNVKGMDEAMKMAQTIADADPWGKMRSGVESISISIGTKLLPVILPVIDKVNQMVGSTMSWIDRNPELAKSIGMVSLAVIGATGTIALFGMATGWAEVMTTGWKTATDLMFSPLKKMALAIWGAMPPIWSFITSVATTPITLAGLRAGLFSAAQSVWGFTTALLANPFTWWVVGISSVIVLVAFAIRYWKDWTTVAGQLGGAILTGLTATKNLIIDTTSRFLEFIGVFSAVDFVISALDSFKLGWQSLSDGIISSLNSVVVTSTGLIDSFKAGWQGFKYWLFGLNLFEGISTAINNTVGLVNGLIDSFKAGWQGFKYWLFGLNPFDGIISGLNNVIGLANKIPGINIDPIQAAPSPLVTSPKVSPQGGGIIKQMSKISNSSNNFSIGEFKVNNSGPNINGAKLIDEMKFAFGG